MQKNYPMNKIILPAIFLLIIGIAAWFYFSDSQVGKAQGYFQRFGQYSLLFSWLPVVGDLLTLAAGIFNVRLAPFLILVATGKCLRYLGVVYLGLTI